ncbi:hypothetical protein IG631_14370 [Alternaria alternata]|jgi:hypothetical protein|nr:hypothetical protein IG631_14370 [Alternaria alternata]
MQATNYGICSLSYKKVQTDLLKAYIETYRLHNPPLKMSEIKGYEIGEINAKAAFTSDIILDARIDLPSCVNAQELGRRDMDVRKGMYITYLPYQPHPITGQIMAGGRYLFETWEDVLDYDHWTTNVYETGDPPEKFWSRSTMQKVERWNWHVAGACHFSHPETHGLSRFQRWSYSGDKVEEHLREVYPRIRDAAKVYEAAGVWLLYQPDANLIGLFSIMRKPENLDSSSLYEAIEDLKAQPSLGPLFPESLSVRSVFDRSSLNLSMWLPKSRLAGGVHQANTLAPILPPVTV